MECKAEDNEEQGLLVIQSAFPSVAVTREDVVFEELEDRRGLADGRQWRQRRKSKCGQIV